MSCLSGRERSTLSASASDYQSVEIDDESVCLSEAVDEALKRGRVGIDDTSAVGAGQVDVCGQCDRVVGRRPVARGKPVGPHRALRAGRDSGRRWRGSRQDSAGDFLVDLFRCPVAEVVDGVEHQLTLGVSRWPCSRSTLCHGRRGFGVASMV